MLTGKTPFASVNEFEVFQKIINVEYEFPDEVPDSAKDLIRQLIKKNPR